MRLCLRRDGRFTVVGSATDGLEGVELVDELQPNLIVLDDHMPICRGLEAIPRMRSASPDSRIVMFSTTVNVDRTDLASDLGADAVVSKFAPLTSLVRTALALMEA